MSLPPADSSAPAESPARTAAPRLPEKPSLEGVEERWAAAWEAQGTYRFDRTRTREQVYSIDTPPPTVSGSLREALNSLDSDRGFLKMGGVFSDEMIDAYIELKMAEVERTDMTPHPVEFDMYYSV